MKNTMKTIAKNEVFESLAHYLTLRKAYQNIDTLIYLDAVGEPNAQSFYYSYVSFLGSED